MLSQLAKTAAFGRKQNCFKGRKGGGMLNTCPEHLVCVCMGCFTQDSLPKCVAKSSRSLSGLTLQFLLLHLRLLLKFHGAGMRC